MSIENDDPDSVSAEDDPEFVRISISLLGWIHFMCLIDVFLF